MKNETFYSNAKLLITGEYVVLDGSWALATPLRVGQKMEVFEHAPTLLWKNFDRNGKLWFEAEFELSPDFKELFLQKKDIRNTASNPQTNSEIKPCFFAKPRCGSSQPPQF